MGVTSCWDPGLALVAPSPMAWLSGSTVKTLLAGFYCFWVFWCVDEREVICTSLLVLSRLERVICRDVHEWQVTGLILSGSGIFPFHVLDFPTSFSLIFF